MKRISAILSAAMLAAAAALMGGCHGTYVATATPGVAYYDYHYYPDSEVYYYPSASIYYWHENDGWAHGRDLPSRFHVDREQHVSLHLNTERPFERHEEIRRQYPGRH